MNSIPDSTHALPLEAVICTELLQQRGSRATAPAQERRAFDGLMHEMARPDGETMQKLAEVVLHLCRAQSSGVSIAEETQGGKRFRWHATAGRWMRYLGGIMPYDASPCGTVVSRSSPLLMSRPQRHYDIPPTLQPAVEEVLLVPFHVASQPAGTVWCVSHDKHCRFDAEDLRVLTALSEYAAMAFLVHSLPELQARLEARLSG